GRTTVLAALLALVAAVALWLSDCIPGFGLGSGTKEGEAGESEKSEKSEKSEQATPAEPEPPAEDEPEQQPSVRKPMPMKLTVDARGCSVNGGDPIDCATLCDDAELFEGVGSVVIDAKRGPHGVVVEILDCLKSKNLSVAISRE